MKVPRPTYSGVVATLALVVAVSGTAYAAGVLPKHSVGTKQLKNHSVAATKIKPSAVGGTAIADGSVTSADLADHGVGSADLDPAILAQIGAAATTGSPAYAHDSNDTVQQVASQFATKIDTFTLPQPGRWFVSVLVRAFPTAASPASRLSCSLGGAGADVHGEVFQNVQLPPASVGVAVVPMQGSVTVTAATGVDLQCSIPINGGAATVSWTMDAFRVQG
jgi:hypothetical protein